MTACLLWPSSSPKLCSSNHRPIAATRKMVGKYTQQVSSRITTWRVGHIIYRVGHVKLPTCKFITKSKQQSHSSILTSCLGWQVTYILIKKQNKTKQTQTNKQKHQTPHNPEKKWSHILVEIPNREKTKLNWRILITKLCQIWGGW